MEHKPIHLITSLQVNQVLERCNQAGIDVEAIAEDYTQNEGYHTHAYITWPIGNDHYGRAVLKPKKTNWCRGVHRKYGCPICKNNCGGIRCPACGIYIKTKYPKSEGDIERVKAYINRKVGALFRDQNGIFSRYQPNEGPTQGKNHSPESSELSDTNRDL